MNAGGDFWGGALLLLLGVAIIARTLRGQLTNRIADLIGGG